MNYFLVLLILFSFSVFAETKPEQPAAPGAAATEADEDYQVDYEEEPDEVEAPAPKKAATKPNKKGAKDKNTDKSVTTQGSRATNRFVFPAKSDTKSVYKKNGVALDVDTD